MRSDFRRGAGRDSDEGSSGPCSLRNHRHHRPGAGDGEISTSCYVEIPKIAREVIREIGYDNAEQRFDGSTCAVLTAIDEQSPDIAMGVNEALEYRGDSLAGDAGADNTTALARGSGADVWLRLR